MSVSWILCRTVCTSRFSGGQWKTSRPAPPIHPAPAHNVQTDMDDQSARRLPRPEIGRERSGKWHPPFGGGNDRLERKNMQEVRGLHRKVVVLHKSRSVVTKTLIGGAPEVQVGSAMVAVSGLASPWKVRQIMKERLGRERSWSSADKLAGGGCGFPRCFAAFVALRDEEHASCGLHNTRTIGDGRLGRQIVRPWSRRICKALGGPIILRRVSRCCATLRIVAGRHRPAASEGVIAYIIQVAQAELREVWSCQAVDFRRSYCRSIAAAGEFRVGKHRLEQGETSRCQDDAAISGEPLALNTRTLPVSSPTPRRPIGVRRKIIG